MYVWNSGNSTNSHIMNGLVRDLIHLIFPHYFEIHMDSPCKKGKRKSKIRNIKLNANIKNNDLTHVKEMKISGVKEKINYVNKICLMHTLLCKNVEQKFETHYNQILTM